MAYVGITNQAIGSTSASGATYLYAITAALKLAGWRVMAWGGGVTTGGYGPYDPSGYATDPLSSPAAWTSQTAWKVMKEPSPGTREFVFLVRTGSDGIIKYSRASTFATGGSATTCPTTGGGDGRVLIGVGSDATATGGAGTVGGLTGTVWPGYVQAVASDTAVNGVYGFWAWAYPAGGSNVGSSFMIQEPMGIGSTAPLDADPSAQVSFAGPASVAGVLGGANSWNYWQSYGLAGATYFTGQPTNVYAVQSTSTAALTLTFPFNAGAPLYGGVPLYPSIVGGSLSGKIYPKGFTTGCVFVPTTQNFLDTFNLASADPRVVVQVTTSTTIPLQMAVPWVTGVVPQV
jgi:hypothetical protein